MAADGSGVLVLAPGEGQPLAWLGQRLLYLARGEQTGGGYALFRASMAPGASPPPHIQHREHEAFYVLDGELTFTAGSETVVLSKGGFVNIAKGTAHTLRNTGATPAAVLVLVAPAGFDAFQFEIGRPLTDPEASPGPARPQDIELMRRLAPSYGIDLDPPPEAFQRPPRIKVTRPGEGEALTVVGDLYTYLAAGEDTDDTYAMIHALVPPGAGPPPHIHRREAEAFYVLEGEITFHASARSVVARPSAFVHVPSGTLHNFKNETDRPARMLFFVAPSGMERFFREVGRPVADRNAPPPSPAEEDIGRIIEAAPRYGLEIPPPPGGGG